jgi:hypothetical protein
VRATARDGQQPILDGANRSRHPVSMRNGGFELHFVRAALACVMRLARRAHPLARMSGKKEPLALVTPTPTILRVLTAYTVIEKDCIMATLACVVCSARRTPPLARIPREKESLALVTPLPIPLLGAYGFS